MRAPRTTACRRAENFDSSRLMTPAMARCPTLNCRNMRDGVHWLFDMLAAATRPAMPVRISPSAGDSKLDSASKRACCRSEG